MSTMTTTARTAPPARRDTRRPNPRPGRRKPFAVSPAEAARRQQAHYWFADRLLEVLSGQRPASWMLRHMSGEATYDQLWQLAAQGVLHPPAGKPTPVVERCDKRAPAPDVLEAFARIASGDTLRALAFRLERGLDQRWRCTAIEFAGPSW
jgi:Family of unknown function (DUF6459)